MGFFGAGSSVTTAALAPAATDPAGGCRPAAIRLSSSSVVLLPVLSGGAAPAPLILGVACGVGFRRSVSLFVGRVSRSCLSCKLGNDDPQQMSRQCDEGLEVSAPLEDVGWFWRPRAFCCLKLLAFGKLGNDDLPKRLSVVKKERRHAISQQHKPLRKEPSTRSATAKHCLLSLGLNLRLEPDCLPSYLWWPHHPSTQLPPNTITYTWSPHGPQTNTPLLTNPCSTMGFKESPLMLLPSVSNPHWPSDHHIHPHHGAPRLDRETDWTYDGRSSKDKVGTQP
uniref:Uncharacterized protein n=1 Tax=Oryza glumipatula TaxID=40148 RepID=A0A0D9YAV3_9ORYZ